MTFVISGVGVPDELIAMILQTEREYLMHPVCRMVCSKWRKFLLNSPRLMPPVVWIGDVGTKWGIPLLRWARENGCPWNETTCRYVAAYGKLETLQWLRSENNGVGICPWDRYLTACCYINSNFDALKWAVENGCPMNEYPLHFAIMDGEIESLKWLVNLKNANPGSLQTSPVQYVSEAGRLAKMADRLAEMDTLIEWISWEETQLQRHPFRTKWKKILMKNAIKKGQIDLLKWMRSQNPPYPFIEKACRIAAKSKQLETLKWLRNPDVIPEEPCSWKQEEIYAIALKKNNFKMALWCSPFQNN
jgi:hypothetical protein